MGGEVGGEGLSRGEDIGICNGVVIRMRCAGGSGGVFLYIGIIMRIMWSRDRYDKGHSACLLYLVASGHAVIISCLRSNAIDTKHIAYKVAILNKDDKPFEAEGVLGRDNKKDLLYKHNIEDQDSEEFLLVGALKLHPNIMMCVLGFTQNPTN